MVQLNYRDAKPIYEQIKDGLRKLVVSGALSVGDKLPSVRELAAELTINPNTIQRAYRELESTGLIVTVPGKGCFVCDPPDLQVTQRQELLEEFDRITAALLKTGVSSEDLAQMILQGGNEYA